MLRGEQLEKRGGGLPTGEFLRVVFSRVTIAVNQ